jgi:two-component system alkaline phosphatase synthesis response regulator PhoP
MKKVLLVEDDQIIHRIVDGAIRRDFELVSAFSVKEGLEKLVSGHEFAAIIIDRGLPDGDGLSMCTQLREQDHLQNVPVIFLSARDSESDKVSGLFAGADDYMTKPFSPLELKARLHARLRTAPKRLFVGDVEVDLDGIKAFHHDTQGKRELILTPIEFKLLAVLSQNMDRVLNRDALLDKVWGAECHISDRVVDTHISHLRKKLKDTQTQLEALRGEGYRLVISPK